MKLTVNTITADVPTLNGNIYSTECIQKMLESATPKIKEKKILVYAGGDWYPHLSPPLENVIGAVEDAKLENGKIQLDIEICNIIPGISEILNDDDFNITSCVVGTINESDKTVNVDKLLYFYVDQKFTLK